MEESDNIDDEEEIKKKGKLKRIYGVIQKKWHNTKVQKSSVDNLKLAGSISNFEDREEVFENNRPALTKLIRLIEGLNKTNLH